MFLAHLIVSPQAWDAPWRPIISTVRIGTSYKVNFVSANPVNCEVRIRVFKRVDRKWQPKSPRYFMLRWGPPDVGTYEAFVFRRRQGTPLAMVYGKAETRENSFSAVFLLNLQDSSIKVLADDIMNADSDLGRKGLIREYADARWIGEKGMRPADYTRTWKLDFAHQRLVPTKWTIARTYD